MADVADCKNTRNVGLEQERISVEGPPFRTLAVSNQVRTGQDETPIVPVNQACEPISLRKGADENKHRSGGHAFDLVGVRAQDRDLFQSFFSMSFADTGMGPELNVGRLLYLIDQILRHRCRQSIPAHQDHYLVGKLRKIDSRLARGVRSADYIDNFSPAGEGFGRAASVINARALELVDTRSIESPPLHSGRDQQRMTGNLASVSELDDPIGAFCT